MPKVGQIVAGLLGFFLLGIPWARADLEDGTRAYQRGDYGTAYREFLLLAEHGDATAQYRLGVMYENGDGVGRDDAEAARWYRRAADQGYAMAQYKLGSMYRTGRGVDPDSVLAHMWYNLAALGLTGESRKDALQARDNLASLMLKSSISRAERMAWEWRATPEPRMTIPQSSPPITRGTGFVVRPNGILLTAFHVVQDSKRITVLCPGREPGTAAIADTARNNDLAVLRVPMTGMAYLSLARPRSLKR
jgi:Sel1 repeat-containing protein/trypsin-like peptidase